MPVAYVPLLVCISLCVQDDVAVRTLPKHPIRACQRHATCKWVGTRLLFGLTPSFITSHVDGRTLILRALRFLCDFPLFFFFFLSQRM